MEEVAFKKIFDGLEKKAEARIKQEDGDYIVDGLLYCGKCHTKKQTRITLFGEERKPYCLCKCMIDKKQAEQDERDKQEFALRVDKLRHKAFPDERMRNWTFAADDNANERITNISKRYIDNFSVMQKDGKGLLFFGEPGTGKTFSAACIANALIDKGISCLVTNFARIGNTLQGMYEGKQAYLDGLNQVELLVLDDLGIERTTPYMQEIVFNVIDARCRAGLPLIVTTNLTSDELKNAADLSCQRIYSRLFECCIPIEVKGVDRRRGKLKHDFKEYNDLLGL